MLDGSTLSVYDPAAMGPLEVPPSMRAAVLPQTYNDRAACEDGCAEVPGMAYLACVDRCVQGTYQPHTGLLLDIPEVAGEVLDALPSFGEFAGLVKWGVVGFVAFVALQALRVVR